MAPVSVHPDATSTIATPAMIETGPTQATSGTTTRQASAAPARSEKYSRLMSSGRRANSADTHMPIGRKLMYSPRQMSRSWPTATSWIVVSPVQIASVSSGVTATSTYPTTTPTAAASVHAASSDRVDIASQPARHGDDHGARAEAEQGQADHQIRVVVVELERDDPGVGDLEQERGGADHEDLDQVRRRAGRGGLVADRRRRSKRQKGSGAKVASLVPSRLWRHRCTTSPGDESRPDG